MTDAAIISGSLVDVRNVGMHKCVKLTIHVPAETASQIFAAFGWPTDVNPVSVAVARLTDKAPRQESVTASAGADKPKRTFADLPPPQQAGIMCNEPPFYKFLQERFSDQWYNNQTCISEEDKIAAACVREICSVKSRSDLKRDNTEWASLVLAYRLWQREPEFV